LRHKIIYPASESPIWNFRLQSTIIGVMKTTALLLLSAATAFAGKKAAPPPETWPTSRVFGVSCDSVWPVAVQVLTSNGWGIRSSDRAGGVLTLEWTRGEMRGPFRKINPLVGQYTIEKSTGFWTQYEGFRMASAQAIAVPQGDTCSYTVTVTYHGMVEIDHLHEPSEQQWRILQTNGSFEDKMLSEIEAKLLK
jgi:hypothetical protein